MAGDESMASVTQDKGDGPILQIGENIAVAETTYGKVRGFVLRGHGFERIDRRFRRAMRSRVRDSLAARRESAARSQRQLHSHVVEILALGVEIRTRQRMRVQPRTRQAQLQAAGLIHLDQIGHRQHGAA